MYEKAYKICEDNKMLEGYLYASSRYMPQDEYQKMVMGNEILLEIDNKLTRNCLKNGKKSTEEHSVREKVQGCVLIFGKSCIILSM